MKIWWICDSESSYPLFGIPYLGKEGANRQTNLSQTVVYRLCEYHENSNRNITFDNYLTSFELAQNLFSKCLTLRKQKACIPARFFSILFFLEK